MQLPISAFVALALVLAGSVPAPAGAQVRDDAGRFASPFLPVHHWALDALRRLDAMGAAPPGYDPATGALTRGEAALALEFAAEAGHGAVAAIAGQYLARFAEEFPVTVSALEQQRAEGAALLGGSMAGGAGLREGVVSTGKNTANGWSGAAPVPDRADGLMDVELAAAVFPHMSVSLSPRWAAGSAGVESGDVQARVATVGLWAGRRAPAYRAGRGGGIVLSGAAAFDGGGMFLAEPLRLPWVFGALGPVGFETTLARAARNGDVAHPWFWTARGTVHPHPRLSIGVTRAALMGGEGNPPLTLRALAYMLVGKHDGVDSRVEDQVVSVDLRYRPPLPIPLSVYFEWGAEDSAGAWWQVPGRVVGMLLPAWPGATWLSAGMERAAFAGHCCSNPPWYRHGSFPAGWSAGGAPLGHPLGGEGTEWRAYGDADLLGARVRLSGDAFVRHRGPENLYAPEREGASRGVRVDVAWRPWGGLELNANAEGEKADDWSRATAAITARLFFPRVSFEP